MLYSQPYTDPQGNVRSMPAFGGPLGGLPGDPRSFAAPQYSGQEGNYNATIRELLKAGVSPEDIKKYGPQIAEGKMSAQDFLASAKNRVTGGAGGGGVSGGGGAGGGATGATPPTPPPGAPRNAGALFPRQGLLGGALAVVPSAMSAIEAGQEGRSLEAGVTGAAGLASAVAGAKLGSRFGLPGAAVGLAGGLLSPALGGMAESAKAKLTGQEIAGRPGSISAQSGQRQKGREEALKDAALQAEIAQRYGGAYLQPTLQAMQDLRQNDVDMMIQSEKRLDPIIRQRLNDAMVRQQALMNTQGQNYAMLGTVATAGKLALGAQAEAGANLRTALSQNPYSGSVLSAPNISF
jgi:hypothetical protein